MKPVMSMRLREATSAPVTANTGVPNQSIAVRNEPSIVRFYLTPVPLHLWHFTTLSPFFSSPLPSQFLHFGRFLMLGPRKLSMTVSKP
jgi:hypothetical protein